MSQIIQQEESARAELAQSLEQLAGITVESLVRSEILGTSLDFSGGAPTFQRTLSMFANLSDSSLDNVPVQTLQQLKALADQTIRTFGQIMAFDPSAQSSPAQARDGLIDTVASQYTKVFQEVAPVVAYSVRKGTDFERLEQDAREALTAIEAAGSAAAAEQASTRGETIAVLEEVKRAAAEVGVAQHAIHFKEEADDHLRRSKWWLIATAVFGLFTLLFGVWSLKFYFDTAAGLTVAQSVQIGISKVLVFAVLYFAAIWAGRTYKAQWHNYVVNKHRQNALSTFETFAKAAGDDQTKNAVLLQATQAIFAPQNSGFVSGDSDIAASPQILEIVRNVAGQVRQP